MRTATFTVSLPLVVGMTVVAMLWSARSVRAFSSCLGTISRQGIPKQNLRTSHQFSALATLVPGRQFQQQQRPAVMTTTTTRLWSTSEQVDLEQLEEQIKAKGDEIRQLKADGLDKAGLGPHIEELLALKAGLPATTEEPKAKKEKPAKQQQKKKATPPPSKKVEEMSESELRTNRLAKVELMRKAGVEPFEYTFAATHSSTELNALYDKKLEPGEEDEEANVAVAGRIMTRRVFGKLAFFTLQDASGMIQLQFDKSRLGDTFKVRRVCVET